MRRVATRIEFAVRQWKRRRTHTHKTQRAGRRQEEDSKKKYVGKSNLPAHEIKNKETREGVEKKNKKKARKGRGKTMRETRKKRWENKKTDRRAKERESTALPGHTNIHETKQRKQKTNKRKEENERAQDKPKKKRERER
jgi:hypothetical protein